jgi:putative chitinase
MQMARSRITEAQLRRIMPDAANVAAWLPPLNEALKRFTITSPQRAAAFLAQVAHESGQLNRLVERLGYTAKRLMEVWPNRFPTLEKAGIYAGNPEKLANYIYAKRLGNGDESTGDGWRYRGRGLIQLTGRGNYVTAGSAIGLALEKFPELLEQPMGAALSAAWFWSSRGLNELADDRNDDDDTEDFVKITVTINGGRAGLSERMRYWETAKTVLGA